MSKKNKLDQYYTKPEVAKTFSDKMKDLYKDCSFVEPSAGLGSFSKNFNNIVSFDLDPKFDGCIHSDFLTLANSDIPENIVFVGNPPFGFGGQLALKFLNHCAKLKCKAIGFILPRTFQKMFFQNNIDNCLHLVHEEIVQKRAFILDGSEYDVPCVFQVWERRDKPRETIHAGENTHFVKTNKGDADIALRRVGGKAGKILEGLNHSASSTYFLKSLTTKEDLCYKLKTIEDKLLSESVKTAGVRSVSEDEIVYWLNKQPT